MNDSSKGREPDSNPLPSPGIDSAPGIRLFLDSADPTQWERFLPLGIFYGVTTNPLLLERSEQPCTLENLEGLTREAVRLGAREIQLQTWGRTAGEMTSHASELALFSRFGLDVVIKVPATVVGLGVAAHLHDAGFRITLTAAYTPGQVLAAAGLGAAYVAPYLGRLNDAGLDGFTILNSMRDVLSNCGSSTRLLVASLRHADQVVELARNGFDTLTFGTGVATELLEEKLTEEAASDFQRAAEMMSGPKAG